MSFSSLFSHHPNSVLVRLETDEHAHSVDNFDIGVATENPRPKRHY